MRSSIAIATAVAGALAVPLVVAGSAGAQSGPAPKPEYKFEKCYGIVKPGSNDCQTSNVGSVLIR